MSVQAPDTPVVEDVAIPAEAADVVEQDLLVEDVSIDGMCGVY
jgi:mycofactocin precursor